MSWKQKNSLLFFVTLKRIHSKDSERGKNDNLPPTHTLFIETYKCLYRIVGSAGELAKSRMFNFDESKRNVCIYIHSQYSGRFPFFHSVSAQRHQHFNVTHLTLQYLWYSLANIGTNRYSAELFSWTTIFMRMCNVMQSIWHNSYFSRLLFQGWFSVRTLIRVHNALNRNIYAKWVYEHVISIWSYIDLKKWSKNTFW